MKLPASVAFAAACLAAATFARAQATPVVGDSIVPAEQTVKLAKFEVTGSYIPFAGTQTALPVTVFDSQAIEDTGVATNLLDVLRKIAPQFSGNGNIGNANAGTSLGLTGGGSMLSFRNVQTLVLVNGRRMAYAPALAAGGLQFVDVNLIPLSAIDRIEILQDGASATYGTDAVAGVVNIILKKNYQGAEVDARYGVSTNPGHYAERSFSLVGGTGSGPTEITFSAEYTHSDPLPQYQRDFANPSYGTATFAGVINTRTPNTVPQFYVLNPSLNAPPPGHTPLATLVAAGVYLPVNGNNLSFGLGAEQQYALNLALYTKLLEENERRSATLNLEHRVSDRVTFFGDFIYAATHTFTALNAQPFSPTLSPSNSSNPTTQTMQVRNRFLDHPRLFTYDSTSVRGIAGARGTFASDLTWEAAVDRNVISQDYRNQNLIDSTLRAAAIANGLLDLAARVQAPGAIDASGVFGTAWGKADSTLTTGDARITGQAFDLPAGPVGFALGTEYRVETLKQDSDPNSQSATFNWDSGVTIDPFHQRREIWSTFAELRVPLVGERQHVTAVRTLDLSAAVRHEQYSDTDHPTVPKVSLSWHPVGDELLLRATYSRSFVAPTLFELFGPTTAYAEDTYEFNQLGGGEVARDFHVRSGANPGLRPSHSVNSTFGVVWSPRAVKGLAITADYFDIRQTDLVATIGADVTIQDVELKGPASPYAQFVKVGAYDGTAIAQPGQLSADTSGDVYVSDTLVNIANLKLRGVDLKADYHHRTAGAGRIDASVAVTSYLSYTYQTLPSVAQVETVGLVTDGNGTLPRWQSNAAVAWSLGRWRTNLDWQHIPGVQDPLGDGTARKPFATQAYDVFDVAVAWTIDLHRRWVKRLVLHAGVNNVFNRMPPLSGGSFPGANADTGTYSPIGRLAFVEAKYQY
jgi:iron complex outermembrane receptor protein